MNRIATHLTTLAASVLFCSFAEANDPALQALDTRVRALESRLSEIEKSMNSDSESSYSYRNAATLEATKGTAPVTAPTPPAASVPPGQPQGGTTYVIQDGDTLGKIAEKHGIERKALLEANRLSEGQPIYIGETLMIPGSVVANTPPTIPAPPVPTGNTAETHKPTPPAKQESLVVGDTNKPAAPAAPASKTHTVAKGDTLTSLAKRYGTTVESLKSANGLRNDTISLGQTLKLPAAKAGNGQNTAKAPEQNGEFQYDNPLLKGNETYGYYTVVKGDNLYALARDFFTTMSELQRINKLGSSTVIRPGDELIVPTAKYNAYHKSGEMANR